MIDYILVIYLQAHDPHYVGTFENCDDAEKYARHYYTQFDSGCQHRDYIYLPKDLREEYIIYRANRFIKLQSD
jgi:hypothetical protein